MKTSRLLSLALVLCMTIGVVTSANFRTAAAPAAKLDESYMLHQEGNQIFNAKGEAVRLLGVNVPQLSWSATGDGTVRTALDVALRDYKSNVIRLAVVPRFWLHGAFQTRTVTINGKTVVQNVLDENGNPIQTTTAEEYRALVDELVDKITAAGKYVILDNHGFYLPTQKDIDFWKSAAAHYKNHPNVIFGVFNEPAGCTWREFYEGGHIVFEGTNDWGAYEEVDVVSPGIPALVKAIRETGAKNMMTISGINWGFDLTYITEKNLREFATYIAQDMVENKTLKESQVDEWVNNYIDKYLLDDPNGNGIIFETHPYPSKPSDWDDYLKDTIMEYPVLVGECGPTELENGYIRKLTDNDISYLDKLAAYMDKYELHLTAWGLGAWPHLSKYPSIEAPSAYGEYMMDYITKNQATKAVTMYDKADYKGNSISLYPGKYTASSLKSRGFTLENISSMLRKESYYQYTVVFYQNENFSGKTYQVVPNVKSLNTSMIGFAPKSVKITRTVAQNLLPGHATVHVSGAVGGTTGDALIDGKNSTYWQSTVSGGSVVTIKLDGLYALTGISLAHAAEANMLSVFNASDYTISVSTNGVLYTRIVDVTNNNNGLTSYKFDQVVASYIRINIRKGGLLDPDTVYLAEVMAYGAKYNGDVKALPNQIPGKVTEVVKPGTDITDVIDDTDTTSVEDTTTIPGETAQTDEPTVTTTNSASRPADNTDNAGFPAWAIILIVVAGIAVLASGGFLVVKFNSKKKVDSE